MHVFDSEMLYLRHKHLEKSVAAAAEYAVDVLIRDYSRAGLAQRHLGLHWRLKGETNWRRVPLESAGQAEVHAASIPGPHVGRTIEYYLAAADLSGREGTLPRTAPVAYYSFEVAAAGKQQR